MGCSTLQRSALRKGSLPSPGRGSSSCCDPLVRKDGSLKAATWDEALDAIASGIGAGKGLAALASTKLPAEALAYFKSLFADKLAADTVTSLEEGAATASLSKLAEKLGKSFESSLDVLKDTEAVLSLELDLVKDHQVAGFFVKRQLQEGTKLFVAGCDDCAWLLMLKSPSLSTLAAKQFCW